MIAAVDLKVNEYEKNQKWLEILSKIENKTYTKLKNGHVFRKQALMSKERALLHDGLVYWKTATGRFKGTVAPPIRSLLLSYIFLIQPRTDFQKKKILLTCGYTYRNPWLLQVETSSCEVQWVNVTGWYTCLTCCPEKSPSHVCSWMWKPVMCEVESSGHCWHRNFLLNVVCWKQEQPTLHSASLLCAKTAWGFQTMEGRNEKTLNIILVIQ